MRADRDGKRREHQREDRHAGLEGMEVVGIVAEGQRG